MDVQPFGPVGIEEAHRVPRSRIKSPQSFLASFTVWSFSIGELSILQVAPKFSGKKIGSKIEVAGLGVQ